MIKNPILLDCPFPITTKRLMIRPVMQGDGKAINECVGESFDQFKEWLPWAQTVPTVEESEEFARIGYADFILKKAFHLGMFHNNRFIGMCGFHDFKWEVPSAQIGYWCRISEQNKGYVKEAVAALTKYGFEHMGLRRISILCDDDNTASCAVASATGFVLESISLGIHAMPQKEHLNKTRCYVRFDAVGL